MDVAEIRRRGPPVNPWRLGFEGGMRATQAAGGSYNRSSNHSLETSMQPGGVAEVSPPQDAKAKIANGIKTKRSRSESSADEYQSTTATNNKSQHNNNNELQMWQNEMTGQTGATPAQPHQKRSAPPATSDGVSQRLSDIVDVAIRVILVFVFIKLETTTSFKRLIHAEELWLYKNPRTPDIVTPSALLVSVILGPFCLTILQYLLRRDRRDFRAASWTWTLILCFNGIATSLLKVTVGRPRPDFYYRCFPDGNGTAPATAFLDLLQCTGSAHDINEGHKSFPSGHASFAFASYGFISLYLAGKLRTFGRRGRGQTWRLCVFILPLLLAALVAVSRTCDYHHHWQDVVVGSFIGIATAYLVYRQYYPPLSSPHCHRPLGRAATPAHPYKHVPSTDPDIGRTCDVTVSAEDGEDEAEEGAAGGGLEYKRLIGGGQQEDKWF